MKIQVEREDKEKTKSQAQGRARRNRDIDAGGLRGRGRSECYRERTERGNCEAAAATHSTAEFDLGGRVTGSKQVKLKS